MSGTTVGSTESDRTDGGRGTLWHNGHFLTFWFGESVSQFGQQITQLAVRLTAVTVFAASAGKLGLLNSISFAPYLLFTLLAGKLADIVDRRLMMIVCNLGRAIIFIVLPVLAHLGVLRFSHLLVLSFLAATFGVGFDVSYQSFVPVLLPKESLVEGNSKLFASTSAAQIGGPGVGGLLIQWLTAPITLIANGVAFFVSVICLLTLKTPQRDVPVVASARGGIFHGLRFIFAEPRLRPCVLQGASYNLFWMAMQTVFLVYAADQLDFSAGIIGVVIGAGAVGSLIGSMFARRLSARFGFGAATVAAVGAQCVGILLIPLFSGSRPLTIAWLTMSFFIMGLGTTVTNVNLVSLRQTITPPDLLGRMSAGYRFFTWGVVPIGALVGGGLAGLLGDRAALLVIGVLVFISVAAVYFSPVRRFTVLPDGSEEPSPA